MKKNDFLNGIKKKWNGIRMDKTKITQIEAKDLQPSQFYINEDKLLLERGFNIDIFEPIPIKRLGQDMVMTDGHTRTTYLIQNGYQYIPTIEERDALNYVYKNDLWIFIDKINNARYTPIAFVIADFDPLMKEGILEWIQVIPEFRGRALGKFLVAELLSRMKGKAKFATVSGNCNNISNPIASYRKIGFVGDIIWYIAYKDLEEN